MTATGDGDPNETEGESRPVFEGTDDDATLQLLAEEVSAKA
jgi:hypothetical protein